jgi:hypothetical protein
MFGTRQKPGFSERVRLLYLLHHHPEAGLFLKSPASSFFHLFTRNVHRAIN